jgi:DNA helicase HerA-like ATPase
MDAELKGLPFPNEMIGSRAIIQGASGAGKTYAIRKILETTHGKMQHFILDVEDELFTLREKFDYVLIGGEHADAPLGDAAALARTLLELGVSAIIALNDLKLPEQRAFIGQFIMSMMNAPRALWHPALVVLDESHRYAPNFGQVESSEALVHLATAGRKRGFGAIFATQRLSQLSKDILGQCPNRIMGRVDQALDRRIAADVLGFAPSSNEARDLMRLKHRFWIVGPALAEQPTLIKFAPCITTHLHSGQRNVPPPPAPERVKAMLGALSKATKTAKAPVADYVAMPDHDALRDAEQRGYVQGKETGEIEGRNKAIQDLSSRIERAQALISDALGELASVCRPFEKEGVSLTWLNGPTGPHLPCTHLP